MILILEGPDLAGKTTLANALAATARAAGLKVKRQTKGRPKSADPRVEYEYPVRHFPVDTNTVTICDRWHVGERVYGPLFRKKDILGAAGHYHLDLLLAARGALQVRVDLHDAELCNRYRDRGDAAFNLSQILAAAKRYQELFSGEQVLPTALIGGVNHDHTPVAEWLLAKAEHCARDAAEFPGYIGSPRPQLLLVGDRPGGTSHPDDVLHPAFPPHRQSSGRWLLETILTNVPPAVRTQIGLVNAFVRPDVRVDLEYLDKLLNHPPIVALGRKASEALEEYELPHGVIPHPQWARRFKHNDRAEYASRLLQAATDRRDLLAWK